MKKLTTLLVAFCLFNFQIGLAEVVATDNSYKVKDETTKGSTESKADNALTISSLSLAGAASIAPAYYFACSNNYSTMAFWATSLVYVGSEVLSWSKYKNASEEAMEIYFDKDQDEQLAALSAAEMQTREAAEAAKRKAMTAKIAAAGFAVASVLAFLEQYEWYKGGGTCAGLSSLFENYDQKFELITTENLLASENDTDSYFIINEYSRVLEGKKYSASLKDYNEHKKHETNMNLKSAYLLAMQGINHSLVSNANAGMQDNTIEKMGIFVGAAGAAVAILWGEILLENSATLKAIVNATTRGIVFGSHSAVALIAATQIDSAADELESRANQYTELYGHLAKTTANSITVEDGLTSGSSTETVETTTVTDTLASEYTDMDASSCFSFDSNGSMVEDKSCTCKKTDTCAKPNVPTVEFVGLSTPTALTSSLSSLKNTSSDLNNGSYSSAMQSSSAGLLRNAGAIDKMKKKLQENINARNIKAGADPIDFAAQENAYAKKFNSAVKKSLATMSPSDAKAVMGFALGATAGDTLTDEDLVSKGEDGKVKFNRGAVASAGTGKSGKEDGKDEAKNPFAGMNFLDSKDDPTADELSKRDKKGYDYKKDSNRDNQIVTDSSVSIFTILSTRYMKTAFPLVFEEDKVTKETKETNQTTE